MTCHLTKSRGWGGRGCREGGPVGRETARGRVLRPAGARCVGQQNPVEEREPLWAMVRNLDSILSKMDSGASGPPTGVKQGRAWSHAGAAARITHVGRRNLEVPARLPEGDINQVSGIIKSGTQRTGSAGAGVWKYIISRPTEGLREHREVGWRQGRPTERLGKRAGSQEEIPTGLVPCQPKENRVFRDREGPAGTNASWKWR